MSASIAATEADNGTHTTSTAAMSLSKKIAMLSSDSTLLDIVDRFRQVSVREVQQLQCSTGLDLQQAVHSVLKRTKTNDEMSMDPNKITAYYERTNTSIPPPNNNFLQEELELLMEITGISDQLTAQNILILREEIYKLRTKGESTSQILETLIQKIQNNDGSVGLIPSSRAKRKDGFDNGAEHGGKRQKNSAAVSPSFNIDNSPLRSWLPQQTVPITLKKHPLFGRTLQKLLSNEDLTLEKMRELNRLRQIRLQRRHPTHSSLSISASANSLSSVPTISPMPIDSACNSSPSKRTEHPYLNSEKLRYLKKAKRNNLSTAPNHLQQTNSGGESNQPMLINN